MARIEIPTATESDRQSLNTIHGYVNTMFSEIYGKCLDIQAAVIPPGTVTISSSTSASTLLYSGMILSDGAVFNIADGVTFEIDVPFSCGMHQCFTGNGTVKFSGGHVNVIVPQWWGAESGQNCDAAFAAMWRCYDAQDVILAGNDYSRGILTSGLAYRAHIPAGYYLITDGWHPNSPAGRRVHITGDGEQSTILEMPTDGTEDYLVLFEDRTNGEVLYQNTYNSVYISGLKLVGGKGLYLNAEPDAAFVQRGVTLKNAIVTGFTECGLGSLFGDDPRWAFDTVIIETSAPNTKGLYLPKGMANPSFVNTSIIGCTYRIVTASDKISVSIISGLTMFSLSTDDHECDIWLKTIDPVSSIAGQGVIITGNRFSNENRNGKPVIIIADDDGTAVPEYQRRHSESVSTRRFRDFVFRNNTVAGAGNADDGVSGPVIKSYTGDVGKLLIDCNSLNTGFSEVLWFADHPLMNQADPIIGPNVFYTIGEQPIFCNYHIGRWINSDGTETPSVSTVISPSSSTDIAYKLLSVDSSGDCITMAGATYSGCTNVGSTDFMGGPNSAEVTYSANTGYVLVSCNPTLLASAGLVAGDNIFFDFEAKLPTSRGVSEIDVLLTIGNASRSRAYRWPISPAARWMRYGVSIVANEIPTYINVKLSASADVFGAGVADKIIVAKPRIYRANQRTNLFDPMSIPEIAKANLPPSPTGSVIAFVPDEAGGAVLAFWDSVGSKWRRSTDRAVVS